MNFFKTFLFIILVFVSFSACKKFQNYNTIIEIVVPAVCNNCSLYMFNDEVDYGCYDCPNNALYHDGFNPYPANKTISVTIDWEEYNINVPNTSIDPNKRITFFLREPDSPNSMYDLSANNHEWESGLKAIKPGRSYKWNVQKGTFEETGKVDKKESGSGGGSGSKECHIGTFRKSNGSPKDDTWTLKTDKTGSAFFADLNGFCEGAIFKYKYTLSGSQLNISYTSAKVCGEEQPLPDDESIDFKCTDEGIYIGSDFYKR